MSISDILIFLDDDGLSSLKNRYGEIRGKDLGKTKGRERRNAVCKLTGTVATERRKARMMVKRFGGVSIDDLKNTVVIALHQFRNNFQRSKEFAVAQDRLSNIMLWHTTNSAACER